MTGRRRLPMPQPPPGVTPGVAGHHARRALATNLVAFVVSLAVAIAVSVAILGGCVRIIDVLNQHDGPHPYSTLLATLLLLGFFTGLALILFGPWLVNEFRLRRAHKRDFAEVTNRQFRHCLGCRYDLSGLPPTGNCPECGRPYTDAGLRQSWLWTYTQAEPINPSISSGHRKRSKAATPRLGHPFRK